MVLLDPVFYLTTIKRQLGGQSQDNVGAMVVLLVDWWCRNGTLVVLFPQLHSCSKVALLLAKLSRLLRSCCWMIITLVDYLEIVGLI